MGAGPRWSASRWGVKEVGTWVSLIHLISCRACCVPSTSDISLLSPGSYPLGGIIIHILLPGGLRQTEFKWCAQGHVSSGWLETGPIAKRGRMRTRPLVSVTQVLSGFPASTLDFWVWDDLLAVEGQRVPDFQLLVALALSPFGLLVPMGSLADPFSHIADAPSDPGLGSGEGPVTLSKLCGVPWGRAALSFYVTLSWPGLIWVVTECQVGANACGR